MSLRNKWKSHALSGVMDRFLQRNSLPRMKMYASVARLCRVNPPTIGAHIQFWRNGKIYGVSSQNLSKAQRETNLLRLSTFLYFALSLEEDNDLIHELKERDPLFFYPPESQGLMIEEERLRFRLSSRLGNLSLEDLEVLDDLALYFQLGSEE